MCVADVCVLGTADASVPDGALPPDGGGGTSRCGTLSVVRDDFEDGVRAAIWGQFVDPGSTLNETAGELQIGLPNSGGPYAGYFTASTYDLRGGAFEVEVAEVGGNSTILEVRDYTGKKIQLVADGGGQIEAVLLDVTDPGIRASQPYSPADHRYWRVRGDLDSTVHWEVSANRTDWTELHAEITELDLGNVYAYAAAGGSIGSPSVARFAGVNPDPAELGNCPAASLADGFTGGGIEPEWWWWNDAECSVTENAGKLEMDFLGANDCWAGVQSQHVFDLSESSFTVDADGISNAASVVSFMQIIQVNGSDQTKLEIGVDGDWIYFEEYENGTLIDDAGGTYDPVDDRWWRIRGHAGRGYLETSPDGAAWTPRLDVAAFDVTAVHLILGAGNYNVVGSPFVVTWDSLN